MADRTRYVPGSEPQAEPRLESAVEVRPTRPAPVVERRRPTPPPVPETVTAAINDLSEGMNTLIRGHMQLARVEMKQELRSLARDLVLELGGAPLAFIGYLLLSVTAALALALVLPYWAAFLIVGGLNFLLGVGLMAWGALRLRKEKLELPASTSELKKDRDWAPTLRESPDSMREHLH